MARDEALLEYKVDAETVAPSTVSSPRLDAMDVCNAMTRRSAVQSLGSLPSDVLRLADAQSISEVGPTHTGQPWWGLSEPENPNQEFGLDWSWLSGELGPIEYQTGDPTTFWSQLQQA